MSMPDLAPITLSEAEVIEITGYHRPAYQLEVLKEMGIPARRRPDNSVMVLRVYVSTRPGVENSPKIKEPQLRIVRK